MFLLKLNNNEVLYDAFTFPGGERHVKISKANIPVAIVMDVYISAHIKSAQDIIELGLLVNAVRGLERVDNRAVFTLDLPYFPYGRQDRRCNFGEPLSAKWFGDMINSMGFDRVNIKDPHSDVTANVLDNVHIEEQHQIVLRKLAWFIRLNSVVLVAPDAGSVKKIETLSKAVGGIPIIYGRKNRDLLTGEITNISVDNPELISGRNLLVVDDICDGGRTFVELAKVIKPHGPNSLSLFVTHGIFSKGLSVFDDLYDNIFSDVWWENTPDNDGIIQAKSKHKEGQLK